MSEICHKCRTPLPVGTDASGTVIIGVCRKCHPLSDSSLPDSGSRTHFQTGAVRDAMQGKGFPSMIPPCAIRAMAKRFEDGAQKYGRMNFAKGIPLSRYIDALMRHSMQWAEGDTAEDHGGAVLWNMACAMWTLEQIKAGKLPKELDDRPYASTNA